MARRSADPDSITRSSVGLRRSDRFLIGLHEAERVVFVSHINPDPDSLGSMLGLAHLVETQLGKPTLLTRDGLVSRAENRAMVDVLRPRPRADRGSGVASGRRGRDGGQPAEHRSAHSLPETIDLYAVIDHHDTPGDLEGVPFMDIRSNLGATCTLVTKYLRRAGRPDSREGRDGPALRDRDGSHRLPARSRSRGR